MDNKVLWMVRAESGDRIEKFLQDNIVAIGWKELGNLSAFKSLNELKDKYQIIYSDSKRGAININSGQLYRFGFEFKNGDNVITYNPNERVYHIGEIISDYQYSKDTEYPHFHRIKWIKQISRDILSTSTKNSLGSTLTVFKLPETAIIEILDLSPTKQEEVEVIENEGEDLDTYKADIENKAKEFIKDKLLKLEWDEMQELVAGILRGMGYKTIVSPKGSDRGQDVIASPDGLGLEEPKIKVEVKHRKGQMGTPEIRSFLGGLRPKEKGLYVSTGGFSKESKYEADRANNPITLIDLELLVTLIIQHYDNLDPEARALIPLKKIYWPN